MNSTMLMGATGLVGSAALPILAAQYDTVWVPGRRAPKAIPENARFVYTDFSDFQALDEAVTPAPNVLCIAFGTTIKQAGSQARFREIDHDYPLALARWAVAHGTRRICLISAVGADAASRVFYNRVKGELEEALQAMSLESLSILRPSLLLGPHPGRPLETLGQWVMGPMAPVLPARIRPIQAAQLARVLVRCAGSDAAIGTRILEGSALFE